MTRAEAWRKIAENLSDPAYPFSGLCIEVSWLYFDGLSSEDSYAMQNQCQSHVNAMEKYHISPMLGGIYAYPRGEEREARILAALWMAHEAEEDSAR